MDDRMVLARIGELIDEERTIHARKGEGALPPADVQREAHLDMAIGQCWDYLRQRRAARAAGRDPDTAGIRPPEEVANYLQ